MNESTMNLLRLIEQNPGLPVVPMVDGEIPGDDCGYWLAAWGHAAVDEYLITESRMCFKSDDDVFDTLERCLSVEEFEALPEAESECRMYYDALPWKKAIIVYVVPARDER